MIEEIILDGVACFTQQSFNPKTINFIYGANGSGKTTISRVVHNPNSSIYNNCQIKWKEGKPLKTLVYNKDFVERNFGQESVLKGVFTLGEESKEIENEILTKEAEAETKKQKIDGLNKALKEKREEWDNIHREITDLC